MGGKAKNIVLVLEFLVLQLEILNRTYPLPHLTTCCKQRVNKYKLMSEQSNLMSRRVKKYTAKACSFLPCSQYQLHLLLTVQTYSYKSACNFIRVTSPEELLKMPRLYFRSVKSEYLKMGPRHQYFLKALPEARIENH